MIECMNARTHSRTYALIHTDSLMNVKATGKVDVSGNYMKYNGRSLRDHSTNGQWQPATLHMYHTNGEV